VIPRCEYKYIYRPAVLTRGGEKEKEREEDVDRSWVREQASGGGEGVRKRKITEGREGRELAGR